MSEPLKAGIIGASGYTGAELLRLLAGHEGIEVEVATANQFAGERISSLYPSLGGAYPGRFERFDPADAAGRCDVFFLGLPHGESMKVMGKIALPGKKVVDLSADFRLGDPGEYREWYGEEHLEKEILSEAVYGLPEYYRKEIAAADVTAGPGCYPTAALLALMPAAAGGLISGTVVIDAKSGISGAGRKLTLATHYPQAADGMEPYAVSGHRHLPEITGQLARAAGGKRNEVVFVPHLAPMNRGILCTAYAPLAEPMSGVEARALYERAYEGERFVRVLGEGEYPRTKSVQGSNDCHLAVETCAGGGTLVVMTAIDNLVKGASGQAVQDMNLMCGMPEESGLEGAGLFP